MNKYVVSMALALLVAVGEPVTGQTAARVEFHTGGIGVSVAIGDLPVRVRPHASTAVRWVAADWGPVRIWGIGAPPVWRRDVLRKQDLRYLLGKETVRRIERHARDMRIAGPVEGRWFRVDRYTTLLEVTVRGIPVAELYDYGGDGYIDRVLLTSPNGGAWHSGIRPAPAMVRPQAVVVSTARVWDRRGAKYKENPGKRGQGKGKKNQ